ncbi:LysR substrate-binding domain-containing protein [Cellulomonas sp. 179-A 4D5 NHS]|uniref:LysR substrate-binding domain-containing protein n=1 Tax=Cellulomonas sp. 179-A 4D5 NHS TaxID=3142378 RepID=UPI0039A0BAB5
MPDDAAPAVAPFRLLVVPGANPAKWLRVWSERLPDVPLVLVQSDAAAQGDPLVAADADAGLVRLPVDRDVLSAIPLYTETSVVVVPKDHVVTAADEVTTADLADETLLVPADDVLVWDSLPGTPPLAGQPATTAAAVELVAAGVGVLVVPQSLARLHHRRDVTYRPVTDAPTSTVALAWVTDRHDERVEEMIGIVRGRTANSSRGTAAAGDAAVAAGPGRGGAGAGGTGKNGAGKTGAGKSSKTGAGKSGAGKSGAGKSGAGKSGAGKSGAPRSGTADRAAAAARRRAGAADGGTRKGRGGRPR